MNTEVIRGIAHQLEGAVQDSDPQVVLDDREEVSFAANRAGFLRLAAEILKAAAADEGARIIQDASWITETAGASRAWRLETTIDPAAAFERRYPTLGRFRAALIFAGVLAFVILAVVGLIAVARWLIQ